MKTIDYKEFNVKTVPLEGSNLIEASAGTGKTFSIAILVLRLLLEKKIPIQEILMVTFTKAAVAELEERIRKFVRTAHRYANYQSEIDEKLIRELVDESMKIHGEEKIKELLDSAILYLDETSVMTIHSFCQQTLNEFAFETRQLFNAELVQDTNDIIEESIHKFWRKNITHLPQEVLKLLLIDKKLSIDSIRSIVNSHLNGKDFVFYESHKKYEINEFVIDEFYGEIQKKTDALTLTQNEVYQYILNNQDHLIEIINNNAHAKKNLQSLVSEPELLMNFVSENIKSRKYIQEIPELVECHEKITSAKENLDKQIDEFLSYILSSAIQQSVQFVNQQKLSRNILSFDDLINNLHRSLHERENHALENELRNKYQAIFIDEFQDTDKLQFEIFEKAFQGHALLFYIGDPKQSIYAWRKADIATYFKAREGVDNVYGMNVNYRSTPDLIEGMNRFFLPKENFDTFAFEGEKSQINYIKVDAPKNSSKGNLTFENQKCVPISISLYKNKAVVYENLSLQILDLLTNENYLIPDLSSNEMRRVRPSDIAILVRSKKDGVEIKSELSKLGIPSVSIDDSKVLQSDEAKEILYVLEAFIHHNRANLNRALMTNYIGWNTDKIQILDEEKLVEKFRLYNEKWRNDGIYSALKSFIVDFNIEQYLLNHPSGNGERIITNLFHLLEILYKTAHRQNFGPNDLLNWLKINIQKNDSNEDEMIQRVESDEDAVSITTIHSSKGLQYPIVFAPTLDFKFKTESNKVYSYRNENGEYKSGKPSQFIDDQFDKVKQQEEQENRRLVYVTLTRAVYKCFIYKNERLGKNTTLTTFLNNLEYDGEFIAKENVSFDKEQLNRYIAEVQGNSKILKVENFHLKENNWLKMSYSGLAARLEWKIKEQFESSDEAYDEFIFKELKKGAQTGNFLHFIFENLDFTYEESWEWVIERAIKRFVSKTDEELYLKLKELVTHVLHTEIQTNNHRFKLSSIRPEKCIHELEFDFPVKTFSPFQLEKLMDEGIIISEKYKGQIEGVMNGKIDLFFEKDGKFYILDWKSNYLGPNVESYSDEQLQQAMSDSNYHLQYLIYCYAVKKYLENRLGAKFNYTRDFGGVFYLFVRGMRNGSDSGIFFNKPSIKTLNQIEYILENPFKTV